jgi:hypothetical protein
MKDVYAPIVIRVILSILFLVLALSGLEKGINWVSFTDVSHMLSLTKTIQKNRLIDRFGTMKLSSAY